MIRVRTLLLLGVCLWLAMPGSSFADEEEQEALARLLPRIEAAATGAIKGPENSRLRVLIAVDTDDQGGATWGRDGLNVKALLESTLKRQRLDGRFSIDLFVGKQVTPEGILDYYKKLKVEPGDALLFYYSGHGGYHVKKGHFLALTYGKLYREDLVAAMSAGKPRLRVLLTDCCANYAGGAFAAEPKGAVVSASSRKDFGSMTPAKREEPKVSHVLTRTPNPQRAIGPPRPSLNGVTPSKAKQEEPAGETIDIVVDQPRNLRRAKREEPPAVAPSSAKAGLPTLSTHQGKVAMGDLLAHSDGRTIRDLFFRHAGLVDINGCGKGELSYGTLAWGGSLFTNSMIALQRTKASDFDKNGNRVVEWSEFFPALRRSTDEAGGRIPRANIRQVPEAGKLGEPILP